MLNRPKITDEVLSQIRRTIAEHPNWGRKRISIHLCELWDWRVSGGQVKDISVFRYRNTEISQNVPIESIKYIFFA